MSIWRNYQIYESLRVCYVFHVSVSQNSARDINKSVPVCIIGQNTQNNFVYSGPLQWESLLKYKKRHSDVI